MVTCRHLLDSSGSSTDVGAIVGGVVGGVVALLCCLAIIGAILFFLFIRKCVISHRTPPTAHVAIETD